jgi:MFS family permease
MQSYAPLDASNLVVDAERAARRFLLAWLACVVFYFLEYLNRSAPAAMLPELAKHFDVSTLGVSSILGVYYYAYALLSLVAGLLLDRLGAKWVIGAGALCLGLGCALFAVPHALIGDVGRLLQGGGSAFAFTGAIYLASHGLPASRLATAVGITQCVGMLGGSAGQLIAGPLVQGPLGAPGFWLISGALVACVAILLFLITPREPRQDHPPASILAALQTYKIVFTNPQSYFCGLVAGLLFAPTTIYDMVWGVRFLQQDRGLPYPTATFLASMVPFGWVIGCPLLGWLADYTGRRKPALLLGIGLMILCLLQLTFAPIPLANWLTLLVFGIASGAAMIPYTIIKEANPDKVKGSATGGMNFLTFSVTAALGPVFATHYGTTLSTVTNHLEHLRQARYFWLVTTLIAMCVTFALKETGKSRHATPVLDVP